MNAQASSHVRPILQSLHLNLRGALFYGFFPVLSRGVSVLRVLLLAFWRNRLARPIAWLQLASAYPANTIGFSRPSRTRRSWRNDARVCSYYGLFFHATRLCHVLPFHSVYMSNHYWRLYTAAAAAAVVVYNKSHLSHGLERVAAASSDGSSLTPFSYMVIRVLFLPLSLLYSAYFILNANHGLVNYGHLALLTLGLRWVSDLPLLREPMGMIAKSCSDKQLSANLHGTHVQPKFL